MTFLFHLQFRQISLTACFHARGTDPSVGFVIDNSLTGVGNELGRRPAHISTIQVWWNLLWCGIVWYCMVCCVMLCHGMVLCGPGAGVGHSWEIRGQLWHSACHYWWGSCPVLGSMVWCDLVPVALRATDTSHPTVEKTKIVCKHLYNLQLDTILTASHNIIFAIMIFLSSISWPWWDISAHCSSSYINESFTQRECLQNSYCSLRVKI